MGAARSKIRTTKCDVTMKAYAALCKFIGFFDALVRICGSVIALAMTGFTLGTGLLYRDLMVIKVTPIGPKVWVRGFVLPGSDTRFVTSPVALDTGQ
jgi:hypothetical protein